jgi:hypothetical protein
VKLCPVKELPQLIKRKVVKTEAAYIGHAGEEIIVKKMGGVKVMQEGKEFETIDDNF